MPSELLQAAGHVVTQVAPQLDGVALSNEGSPLLTPVSPLLEVSSKLVAGAVSVGLTVQGEVSPQRGGVTAQPAVATTGN